LEITVRKLFSRRPTHFRLPGKMRSPLNSLAKLPSLSCKQICTFLRPAKIDEVLYSIDCDVKLSPQSFDGALSIERFNLSRLSGIPSIDHNIRGQRECYVVIEKGEVTHYSWLFFDVLLPWQFGFDPTVPVIGACVTYPAFRGRHIFTKVLNHIISDLNARSVSDKAYILVSPQNTASIRAIERAGFKRLAHLRGARYFGFLLQKN
jgi:hypothetical protein